MSQTPTTEASLNITPDGYVPVKVFHQMLSKNTGSKYTAQFSFEPFLRTVKDQSHPQCTIAAGLFEEMKTRLALLPDAAMLVENPEMLEGVAPLLFPSLFLKGQMGFIAMPFTKHFVFMTPAFKDLLTNEDWEIKLSNLVGHSKARHGALDAGSLVLNRLYGEKTDLTFSELLRVRNRKTGLEKFYKINIILDFLHVEALKPLKKLSRPQIHRLLNDWDDQSLWHKYIPPENFSFKGITVGHVVDVTDREVLAQLEKFNAKEEGDVDYGEGLNYIQGLVRSLLNIPELDFGSSYVLDSAWQSSTSWNLLRRFDPALMHPSFQAPQSPYGKVIQSAKPVIIADLPLEKHLGPLEQEYVRLGYRSLILAPVFQEDGVVGGIMEIASLEPYRFTQMTYLKLEEFVETYSTGMTKFVEAIENQVRLTMQQQFTSIHPSVEWKFREAATHYYWSRTAKGEQLPIQPIVFRDVYPIYGQADIVSSSKLRNKFIQADLTENLELVNHAMNGCREQVRFHLLDVLLKKTNAYLDRLNAGEYVSSDETEIVGLLNREIHPLLHQMREHYAQIPAEVFENYFSQLDPELGIIYHQRKAYEDSVSMLVEAIAAHLETEDDNMQKVLPHFFEKYETDGVEYNIYLGQSILEKGNFSSFFLKDFRLWQLINMCEITRLVERKAAEMQVPLTTAQLIFVYNHSLSIRFHMDEKQFDVDGAYNVRYEILKKRIDKALVKGTGERLTLSGKIAIVYLGEKDKQEYLEYLQFLADEGHITPDIEDLQLERLQGADGLRALRVTVV